jgi:HEPN domain-containing protein
MNEKMFDIEKVKTYWSVEAKEAFEVADHLMEKEDYSYALFFGHLAVEKLLKALYVIRRKEHAPPIHNLFRLASAAGIELDKMKSNSLIRITAFNIEARYPDMKRAFRKKCTAEFSIREMRLIKEIFQWLTSLLP